MLRVNSGSRLAVYLILDVQVAHLRRHELLFVPRRRRQLGSRKERLVVSTTHGWW